MYHPILSSCLIDSSIVVQEYQTYGSANCGRPLFDLSVRGLWMWSSRMVEVCWKRQVMLHPYKYIKVYDRNIESGRAISNYTIGS